MREAEAVFAEMLIEAFEGDVQGMGHAHLRVVHSEDGKNATATVAIFSGDVYELLKRFLAAVAEGKELKIQ
jgi:hypothetical protein